MLRALGRARRSQEFRDGIGFHRLGEVIVEAGCAGLLDVFLLAPPGNRHEKDLRPVGTGPDPARELISIHVRHADIQQRGIWRCPVEHLQGCLTVVRDDDVVAIQPQEHGETLGRVVVVVGDQDTPTPLAIGRARGGGTCFHVVDIHMKTWGWGAAIMAPNTVLPE
jgi:hypothetical protein